MGSTSPIAGEREAERRSAGERRKPPCFPPEFSFHRRRRSSGRRDGDRPGYVDVYDAKTWGVALSILALSCIDAVLTGLQISHGRSREANPFMNLVIYHGGFASFFSLKAAMTAFPLAIIVLHKEWALARFAARLCLWCYISVALYHLYLVLGRRPIFSAIVLLIRVPDPATLTLWKVRGFR